MKAVTKMIYMKGLQCQCEMNTVAAKGGRDLEYRPWEP